MDEHPVLLTEPPHNPTSHREQLAEAFFKTVPYQLPGGQVVELGDEWHRALEVLFRPSLLGSEALPVHDVLLTAIRRSDLDLRPTLFANVVLAGGRPCSRGCATGCCTVGRRWPGWAPGVQGWGWPACQCKQSDAGHAAEKSETFELWLLQYGSSLHPLSLHFFFNIFS